MQDQNRKFYEDFGIRIKFLRKKRGLTLDALGDGKPSTAKSWEDGKLPRNDQWEIIARRLGLSISFVFLGKPTIPEDFTFIAKFADELVEAGAYSEEKEMRSRNWPERMDTDELAGYAYEKGVGNVPSADAVAKIPVRLTPDEVCAKARKEHADQRLAQAEATFREIRVFTETLIKSAQNDPRRAGWILEQMCLHLRTPGHWRYMTGDPEDHPAVKEAIARAHRNAFRADGDKIDTRTEHPKAAS